MTDVPVRLAARVHGYQALFTLVTSGVSAALAPHLLLLSGWAARHGSSAVVFGVVGGGLVAQLHAWLRMSRHRQVLRGLTLSSASFDAVDLGRLEAEPPRLVFGWLIPTMAGLCFFTTVSRPPVLDLTTGSSLCLLGTVIVATAALPLFVLLRTAFIRALELAPPEAMHELIQQSDDDRLHRDRTSPRMLAALVTPVLFVTLGAALIVSAYLRRADERDREETARALARTALEQSQSDGAGAGLSAAMRRAEELGFSIRLLDEDVGYHTERSPDGMVALFTPLDQGGAQVSFRGSTVEALSPLHALAMLVAVAVTAALGVWMGRAFNRDLFNATHRVQVLGTDTVLSGGMAFARPARFRVVAQLGTAIERLAERFRVFAEAQARSIAAREAATRTRGLFLASVSHDLKSPLNAILGFTGLVREREITTPGQAESLDLIERRGRELLALIETILDAARVEAGQLTLVLDYQALEPLLQAAIEKGKDLASEHPVDVICELGDPGIELCVDLVRMPRALGSFIGHAIRTAEQSVRILGRAHGNGILIEIEIPSHTSTARQIQATLDPGRQPGAGEHRGHALGLRLSRSVIELHRGSVSVLEQSNGYPVVRIYLPKSALGTPQARGPAG
jgi:signal transduction histidine kinase